MKKFKDQRRWVVILGGIAALSGFLLMLLVPLQGISAGEGPYPRIATALQQLDRIYSTQGEAAARAFARHHNIDLTGDRVQIVAEVGKSQDAQFLEVQTLLAGQEIVALGGVVEAVHREMIQNTIPLGALPILFQSAHIRNIRLPLRPVSLMTSEGVGKTGADQWLGMPAYRGGGSVVRVCILDLGFEGYSGLLGNELPANVTARSFRADGDIAAGTSHGTACAEVIHDMAPEAHLILVNYSTDVEHHNAVDWIISQEVDIISYSNGWLCAGAGDGTGPIHEDVRKAHESGIIWISAAGNSGQHHWQAKYRDSDKDGWHDFTKGGDADAEYFAFYVDRGESYSVWLNWDDWGNWDGSRYVDAEGQDYDLYLYDKNLNLIARSTNRQTKSEPPVEGIIDKARSRGWRYVRIKKKKADRNCQLELFFWNGRDLEHVVAAGSINVPADSPYAVAVGATGWASDLPHAYTSRGPTVDLRIKPDICAPSGISTQTFDSLGFFGTSVSAAHVAGAFALLKSKSLYSFEQIQDIIRLRALDLGVPGKDNIFGVGRLKLDR